MNRFNIASMIAIAFFVWQAYLYSHLAAAGIVRNRWLADASSDDVVVNRTCVQLYISPIGSSCDNVDLTRQDENSSRLRVALSSLLHACVQLGGDPSVRRLRVLAGTARLYPELHRLGSSFSVASGIPLYFNFSTRLGGTAATIRAAIAQSSVVDTPDMSGGADAFIVGPAYMPYLQQAGKLLDLSQLVGEDLQLKWFQIKKFMREQMVVYGNKVVAIPVTTSPVFLYYHVPTFNRDGLEVPLTWDAVIALAETYHGQDLNGDGQPDFGICMTPPNCFIDGYILQWILASFVQTHGSSNGLFLDPLTLANLANSTAMAEAFTVLRRLRLSGPRFGDCTAFEDQYYLQGRCLLSISPTITFKSAYAPYAPSTYAAMRGNMGISRFPGSTRVLDRTTGQLVPCNTTLCPLATLHAPDQAGISRPINQPTPSNNVVVMINGQSPPKYQFYAYSLFSYLTSPDVLGATGAALLLDPRLETSPLRETDLLPEAQAKWVAAGYDARDVALFFTACRAAMDNPNQIFESKFPSNINVTSALSLAAVIYANASIPYPPPVAVAVARVATAVAAVVEEQGGAATFATIYRHTLNWVPPSPPPAPAIVTPGSSSDGFGASDGASGHHSAAILATAVAVPCGVAVLLAVVVWAFWTRHGGQRGRSGITAAPGAGPDTTLLITDIQSSTSLWEHLDQEVMNIALSLHHSIIRKAIADWSGYESTTEGDSFIVAFRNPTDALLCALAAQQALLHAPWPDELFAYPPLPGLEGDEDPLLPVTALVPSRQQPLPQPPVQPDSSTRPYYYAKPSYSRISRLGRIAGTVSSSKAFAETSGSLNLTYEAPVSVSGLATLQQGDPMPALTPTLPSSPPTGGRGDGCGGAAAGGASEVVASGDCGFEDGRIDRNTLRASVEANQVPPFRRTSTNSDVAPLASVRSGPEDGGVAAIRCGAGEYRGHSGAGDDCMISGQLGGDSASMQAASEISDALGPLEVGGQCTATASAKYHRATHGSTSSGPEIMSTTFTLAASILTSVQIIKGRPALANMYSATTAATAGDPPPEILPSGAIQLQDPNTATLTQARLQVPPFLGRVTPSPMLAAAAMTPSGATTPLFRGLRIRMGMWTGISNPADVSVNATARRTQYSGEIIVLSKLVSDTVHGGMVVIPECTRRRLDPDVVRSSRVYMVYAGQHMLAGAVAAPLHLYTCYSQTLLPRAVVVRPLRTALELRPGALTAPVDYGVVVEMQVVGLSTLLAWNRQVTETSLELLHAAALKLLPTSSGGAAAAAAAGIHIVAGAASLLEPTAVESGAGGGGSGTAGTGGATLPAQGTMIVLFGDPDGAVAWTAALRRAARELTWPPELLEHALAEEVWAAAPATPVAFHRHVATTREPPPAFTDTASSGTTGGMSSSPGTATTAAALPAVSVWPPLSSNQTGGGRGNFGWRRASSGIAASRSRFSGVLWGSRARRSHDQQDRTPVSKGTMGVAAAPNTPPPPPSGCAELGFEPPSREASGIAAGDCNSQESVNVSAPATSGGAFSMQLLLRGLRLRLGIASGPLKGALVVGDISGQVSYKGKAFAQASKLASKARSGQICVTTEFARALPTFLMEEVAIVERV